MPKMLVISGCSQVLNGKANDDAEAGIVNTTKFGGSLIFSTPFALNCLGFDDAISFTVGDNVLKFPGFLAVGF